MNSRKQGNGLLVVMIILTATAFGVYSVSDLIRGESHLNKRTVAYHEARQAAESLIQTNMAEIETFLNSSPTINATLFSPGVGNAMPFINNEFLNAYGTSNNVVMPEKTRYTSIDDYNTEDTEVIGNLIASNAFQSFDNLPSFISSLEILSKATVDRPVVGRSRVLARQFLNIIDTPIFAYAIFYNMPMEIAPGELMNVYGNVHVNGDAWFQSKNGLNFYDNVTISGDLRHGRRKESGKDPKYGDVKIADDSSYSQLVNMKNDNTWSDQANNIIPDGYDWFRTVDDDGNTFDFSTDLADILWGGNLETSSSTRNMLGLNNYVEDTDPETDGRQVFNSAYPIIQPPLNESNIELPQSSDIDFTPESYEQARAIQAFETQKYSYKAGLTIKVDTSGAISYLSYERNPVTNKLVYDSDGNPKVIELTPTDNIAVHKPYSESGGEGTSQLYDQRQETSLNIVELDIEKLKDSLHDETEKDRIWGGTDTAPAPKDWWNGVVYVEFPQQNESSTRDDNVNPAQSGWGLKLVNGETIPNPSFKHGDGIFGTSIATNQMMYVEGHYNADGDSSTGSPTMPDDPSTFAQQDAEAPAALIADSITFLSESWNDANSRANLSSRVAADTEVSAAIMTGNVPSENDNYSGGVENFPRFLENWSEKEIRIRGSMVALFESEVGTERWGKGGVYSPPNRAWGFHDAFRNGLLPPGTPYIRRYLASDFELMSEPDYNQRINEIQTEQANL